MLETTYHHLLETSADAARQRLDAFAERSGQELAARQTHVNDESPELPGLSRHAPGMIRTCDLCLRRAALYPLSYGRGERRV